jgi:hypothetical protein
MQPNDFNKPKLLHATIEVKALAHVYKSNLSSLTNVRKTFWVMENLFNSSCNLKTITTPLVFEISKNLVVTCFASQSLEIKFSTTTKDTPCSF